MNSEQYAKQHNEIRKASMRIDPISDREDDKLWRLIRQRISDRKKLQAMSWSQLAALARELGFEEHARAWERSQVGAR